MRLSKITWLIKQLLPLTYRSYYRTENSEKHFAVWNMWFGKVFNHEDHIVVN